MFRRLRYLDVAIPAMVCVFSLIMANNAEAVPTYARQMNMQCSGCHTRFPKLNAFGRQFKLSGYTMTASKQVNASDADEKSTLSLNQLPPLSIMFQSAYTKVAKAVPDNQNNAVQFPQQASLFFAGRISPKVGSFIQMTYSQEEDNLTMDNAELRYADTTSVGGTPVSYGFSLNNSPTMEDLWNSTPTWGFPFAGPDTSPGPAAATLIDGGLGQDVAGLGGFALVDQTVYVAATVYRSAHLGSTSPSGESFNTVDGVAPYLRVAWQHSWGANYLEVGAYGIKADLIPQGVTGLTDKYKDAAADFQYERTMDQGQLTVHGTVIHETRNLDASYAAGDSANASNTLDTRRIDASYGFDRWDLTAGLFSTSGGSDTGLYSPAEVDGSALSSPDSNGWMVQASYSPWQNVQLMAQYTGYTKFNGASSNYDGFGRSASDNDALFLQAWVVW